MASTADDLRPAARLEVPERPLEERLSLLSGLAEADVALYCAFDGVNRDVTVGRVSSPIGLLPRDNQAAWTGIRATEEA